MRAHAGVVSIRSEIRVANNFAENAPLYLLDVELLLILLLEGIKFEDS
jgi:hypothetical protein